MTGASGQLGNELTKILEGTHQLSLPDSTTLDITNERQVLEVIEACRPQAIIHAAAYTAVDQAESAIDLARRVNVSGSQFVAQAAQRVGAQLIALSTDYVFDGTKKTPYLETDQPHPLNVYGQTKWESEQAILEAAPNSLIFRTAWLFGGGHQHGNFVRSILKRVDQGSPLSVVNDQIGSPTAAADLAGAIVEAIDQKIPGGIYHVVNEGSTSWFDLAQMIVGLIGRPDYPLAPIATSTLHQPARRPAYSALSTAKITSLGISLPDWQTGLEKFLRHIERIA